MARTNKPQLHHLLMAALLTLSLLWQPWASARHAVQMATGTAVCTSTGHTLTVDADGNVVHPQQHACFDCCSNAPPALPAAAAWQEPLPLQHAAPGEPITASRRDAQWLAPLSRGPPRSLLS